MTYADTIGAKQDRARTWALMERIAVGIEALNHDDNTHHARAQRMLNDFMLTTENLTRAILALVEVQAAATDLDIETWREIRMRIAEIEREMP